MTVTHYNGSRGKMEIATMPHPYLVNAHRKLADQNDPSRVGEVSAMAEQIARNDAAFAEIKPAEKAPEAENPRVYVGANNPPGDPFDALAVHANDLLDQARGVTTVENADQLAAVKALEGDLKDAFDLLEAMRVEKKKPLDEQISEIQTTFNVYLAPLTNKTTKGKIPLALDALKKAREPWQQEQDRLKREAAETARLAAEKAAQEVAEAAKTFAPDDLEAREQVEALFQDAEAAKRDAARALASATKGTGLRSYWVPELVDPMAALKHYMTNRSDELKAWLLDQARKDIQVNIRTIPGFEITEERRAV